MFDIISIGSATVDFFLRSSRFPLDRNAVGEKVEVEDFFVSCGGGGTNTAAGFARLGLRTACVARFGNDLFGKVIQNELKKEAFDKKYLLEKKGDVTDCSTILVNPNGSRIILVHRGKTRIDNKSFPWMALDETKWLYVASLEGNVDLLMEVISCARKNNVQIVLNPGSRELVEKKKFFSCLPYTKALILNKEEADMLGIEKLPTEGPEVLVITNGRQGAKLFSQKQNLFAEIFDVDVVDETGAGDAFSVGFVTGLVRGLSFSLALKLGMANSASVISQFGAKGGLLNEGQIELWLKRSLKIF